MLKDLTNNSLTRKHFIEMIKVNVKYIVIIKRKRKLTLEIMRLKNELLVSIEFLKSKYLSIINSDTNYGIVVL